jgi:hypothetical protein
MPQRGTSCAARARSARGREIGRRAKGLSMAKAQLLRTLLAMVASCALALTMSLQTAMATANPAVVTDHSRDTAYVNDFLRITYLPVGVIPQYLGGPSALRVFATASRFFIPPISLAATSSYPGLVNDNTKAVVLFRCKPPDRSLADPFLATWPQVFTAITEDFDGMGFTCPADALTPENELWCLVKDFIDTAQPAASMSLEHAMSLAAELFDPAHPELAATLRKYYGIYPAFSGLGFSIKGSGDGHSLTAQEALRQSIVPEYLLENVQLGVAGCHCVIVDPYAGRSFAPVDPRWIWSRGTSSCVKARRLRRATQ